MQITNLNELMNQAHATSTSVVVPAYLYPQVYAEYEHALEQWECEGEYGMVFDYVSETFLEYL